MCVLNDVYISGRPWPTAMRTIGYYTDPVLIIYDPTLFYGVAGYYIKLPENSHKT